MLTDFFAAFIEISRRTQSEVLLDFKIGRLHLYKNGCLAFEGTGESDNNKYNTLDSSSIRDDLSIIDTASAILSQVGRGSVSIKSTYLENLSIKTPSGPKSVVSKASSKHRSLSTTSHGQRFSSVA